jgi:N-acetylglutamate synthase
MMPEKSTDIRWTTIDDYNDLVDLWKNAEGVGFDVHTDTRDGIAGYLARDLRLSYVVSQERQLIGAVLCGHDGRRGYLHHLAVAPPWRRKGTGRTLVEACLVGLGAIGIRKCNIFLFADNEPGGSFWKDNGWKERSDLKCFQKPTPSEGQE